MTWNAFDEGYLSAYRWSDSLAGGVALPVESTATPLESGEVAHAEIGPVSVAAFVGEEWKYPYPPGLFVFGGPLTFAASGSVAIARDAAWQGEAQRAAVRRWHPQGLVHLVVTDRRLLAIGNGKVGSLAYAQAGAVDLVAGLGGGPAVRLRAGGPARSAARVALGARALGLPCTTWSMGGRPPFPAGRPARAREGERGDSTRKAARILSP